jgi:hypothetical protein
VAVAALLSLLLFVRVPGQGLWYHVLLNASHGPIFAAVAVLILLMHPPGERSDKTAYVSTFFVAIGLGLLIEVLQTMAHRPGQPFDVMTDAAGAAAGLGLWALAERRRGGTGSQSAAARSWRPLAVALAGVTLVVWPPLQAARAYAQRLSEFPTLVQFQSPRDLAFVTTAGLGVAIEGLPPPWARHAGERALRIGFDHGHAPAVQIVEPSPDWRGYSLVAVDLTNPGDAEVRLTFRIHDALHDWVHEDRFNLPLVLPPRARMTVRVALAEVAAAPATRSMDLARIANVMLFGVASAEPGVIYVSRLWLE